MKITIARPQVGNVHTGNQSTTDQWTEILRSQGHEIGFDLDRESDLLVALHAVKSREAILHYRQIGATGRIILALTGTDIYPEPEPDAIESMRIADALVVLQHKALAKIPDAYHKKTRVIIQSVRRTSDFVAAAKQRDPFVILVAGHLRDVKDPMRAAIAARNLPPHSKVVIRHAGAILEKKYQEMVAAEEAANPRYEYLGPLKQEDLHRLIRESQATALTSLSEGGPRILGESIVQGTPVIASNIDGVTGLIGDEYPGLFPVGDTGSLTERLLKLEQDSAYRALLETETKRLADVFDPAQEHAAWKALIRNLTEK